MTVSTSENWGSKQAYHEVHCLCVWCHSAGVWLRAADSRDPHQLDSHMILKGRQFLLTVCNAKPSSYLLPYSKIPYIPPLNFTIFEHKCILVSLFAHVILSGTRPNLASSCYQQSVFTSGHTMYDRIVT